MQLSYAYIPPYPCSEGIVRHGVRDTIVHAAPPVWAGCGLCITPASRRGDVPMAAHRSSSAACVQSLAQLSAPMDSSSTRRLASLAAHILTGRAPRSPCTPSTHTCPAAAMSGPPSLAVDVDVRNLLLEPARSLAEMSPGLSHQMHQPDKQGTVFTHGDGCQIRCPPRPP